MLQNHTDLIHSTISFIDAAPHLSLMTVISNEADFGKTLAELGGFTVLKSIESPANRYRKGKAKLYGFSVSPGRGLETSGSIDLLRRMIDLIFHEGCSMTELAHRVLGRPEDQAAALSYVERYLLSADDGHPVLDFSSVEQCWNDLPLQ